MFSTKSVYVTLGYFSAMFNITIGHGYRINCSDTILKVDHLFDLNEYSGFRVNDKNMNSKNNEHAADVNYWYTNIHTTPGFIHQKCNVMIYFGIFFIPTRNKIKLDWFIN